MGSKKSFAARLSFNILLITTVLFTAAIIIEGISSHRLLADEATRSTERLLDATIFDIEKVLGNVESAVKSTAWIACEHIDEPDFIYHLTERIVTENPDIIGCAVAYRPDYFEGCHWFSPYSYSDPETGTLKSKSLGDEQYDYYDMEWYASVAANGMDHWCEAYLDEGGAGYLMTTYSYPILDENWDVVAVMTADLSLKWIADKMAGIQPYDGSHVNLISAKGQYLNVADLSDQTVYSTLEQAGSPKDLAAIVENMMDGGRGVMRYRRGGKSSFVVFGQLENGWKASITCGYREVLAGTTKMHKRLLLNAFINLLLQFILGFFIIRRITSPLSSISESALSIARGDFNTVLPEIKYEDELFHLRNSFDIMQNSLNTYIRNLKESTAVNERYAGELHIASSIQMAMVPRQFPHTDEIDLEAFIKPAKEVGGDLYDFYRRDNIIHFVIGDVSGKGVPASLVMAMTLFAFRLLGSMHMEVEELVEKVNNSVSKNNANGMFVTLFYGRLNLDTKVLTYCNAGHNPLVVIPPDGKPEFLDCAPNIALGVLDGFKYKRQSVQLSEGSRMILYTDGVTEAERADKEQYGEQRLLKWAADACGCGDASAFCCGGLLSSIHGFIGDNEQNDDITIMTIKI